MSRRTELGIAVAIALATVALYWPVHGFDFINFDDVDYVRGNAAVRAGLTLASIRWAFTSLLGSFWIPLTWLSYMLDTQLYGTAAGGYHVTNALLHVASSVLLFGVLARGTGRAWPSAFVAGLFALHPLHVESVTWVTERKDALSTLFLMLTLAAWGAYAARPTPWRYGLAVAAFAGGLMAKPMLTTMPVLLLLVDLWPLGRFASVPTRRLLLEKLPFLLLALPAAFVTMASGHHIDTRTPLQGLPLDARLANMCESYLVYLLRTVWPSGLAVLYPEHAPPPFGVTALATLALAALTAAALAMARRRPYVTTGWLWYVVALVPVSGLVKIGHFQTADRFTYVPLIGIFVIVAWAGNDLATTPARRTAAGVAAAGVLLAALAAARVQVGYWRDGITLFERTIAVTGPNPVTQYMLGLAFAERGRTEEAIARYTESLRLRPGYAHAHTSLGLLLFEQGRVDEAIAHYTRALEEDPREAYAHNNLGNALVRQGRTAEAIAHYREATRIDPDMAAPHVNLGMLLAEDGRFPEAAEHYLAALRDEPNAPRVHADLGNVLAAEGRLDEAIARYREAIRLEPARASAHNNLANALVMLGRVEEGVAEYGEALRLDPGYAEAHYNLGIVLADHGRRADALRHLDEALRLKPDYAAAAAARRELERAPAS